MLIKEFLDQIRAIEGGNTWIDALEQQFEPEVWQKPLDWELTDPLIKGIAWQLRRVLRQEIEEIIFCSDELYTGMLRAGHSFLNEVYQLAIGLGFTVQLSEIDGPLTMVEDLQDKGYLEPVGSNESRLTPLAHAAAAEIRQEIEALKRQADTN
jgi:hypothetical protein